MVVGSRTLTAGLRLRAARLSSSSSRQCWRVVAYYSTGAALASSSSPQDPPSKVTVNNKTYTTDSWFNTPTKILESTARKLHLQKDHPISITRQIIESKFSSPTFKSYADFDPIVSTAENFDSLGFPPDHPGRSKSDTYYINQSTLLRTHTSAHQAKLFRASSSPGYLISGDVYRRDEIDRSHYPIFHQLEGARVWDRNMVPNGDIVSAIYSDLANLPTHNVQVDDLSPPHHRQRNPLQSEHHTPAEAEAITVHLKRSLELMVVEIFSRAKQAAARQDPDYVDEPLKVRWVEAYFPFTSPSWELEVYYQGDWLEVLGSGVSKQEILINADVPSQIGWAFGIGLDRIAMLLFQIPDIRLFWSSDPRFLKQFTGVGDDLDLLKRFVPFSKYPACPKDVSFWLRPSSAAGGDDRRGNVHDFHENDVMEVVREVAGDVVEDVKLVDEFVHPKTGRRSLCYRINYRSLERTLTGEEAVEMHERVRRGLVERLGVEIR